jgi:hypothetical protein
MKNTTISINWLVPILGIAWLAGGLMGAATHSKLEQNTKTHSGEASCAILDRLRLDWRICGALRSMHEGGVNAAVQKLDLVLCDDIIAINSELASAEAADRAFVTNAFESFARVRPKSAALLAGTGQELSYDQIEAERILEHAATGTIPGIKGLAVLP